jgi:hypothetical protein
LVDLKAFRSVEKSVGTRVGRLEQMRVDQKEPRLAEMKEFEWEHWLADWMAG